MDDNNNKRKKRKKKSKINGCLIGLLKFIIFLSMCFALGTYVFVIATEFNKGIVNHNEKKGKEIKYVDFVINEGDSTKTIAKNLKKDGIINNVSIFVLKCKSEGIDGIFHPGNFKINTYMNFYEIVEVFMNSKNGEIVFTIKEGETIKEIAEKLEGLGIVKANDFINACENGTFDFDFLKSIPQRSNRLEGYLFPDTYFLSQNSTSEEIINKLLTRFDEMYDSQLRIKTKQMNMTMDDIVIIASIIEKEVRYTEERPTVASVIYNRLNADMKLQMDCTVLYALGETKDRVLNSDTKIESEYNTYYVDGLPIGPIGNPGIDCIKAAINPENTDYLYYVVEDDTTGKHFFTSNYNQFLNAKENYVSKFK